MRVPLFLKLQKAREVASHAPESVRHSAILTLDWYYKNDRRLWFLRGHGPSGTSAIDQICNRILRNKWPVRSQELAQLRMLVAGSIYEHSTPLANYERNHVYEFRSGCFVDRRDNGARLCVESRMIWFRGKTVEIKAAPMLPCRWCGRPVFYREEWKKYDGTVRCNGRACRHIDHLNSTSQSAGGIDLTPRQRKAVDRTKWPEQIITNYLLKAANDARKQKRHQAG